MKILSILLEGSLKILNKFFCYRTEVLDTGVLVASCHFRGNQYFQVLFHLMNYTFIFAATQFFWTTDVVLAIFVRNFMQLLVSQNTILMHNLEK